MHGACVSGLPVTDKHQLHQLVASRRAWPGYKKKKNLNPKRNGEIDKTRGSRQFLLNILWGYDADTGNKRTFSCTARVLIPAALHVCRCLTRSEVCSNRPRRLTARLFFFCFSHRPSTTGSFGCDTRFIHFLASFSSQLHYGQLRLVHLLLHTFVSILYILSVICLHFLSFKCRLSHLSPSASACLV